ncbi:MAG: BadF/BadG/BcrA/BcrD ATPase family protein [Thermoanaerobaculia bacterium]|nr:BadF/BadG/BcrA/BcrD ATPase family protein [Thermoanaerobaculia bacterium]
MNVYTGIDLGSTTTKAVILTEDGRILGRGITNSRSDYEVASKIVREEAYVRARFTLASDRLRSDSSMGDLETKFLPALERNFRYRQHLEQLDRLREAMHFITSGHRHDQWRGELTELLDDIVDEMVEKAKEHYAEGASRKSDFFRDIAAADYMHLAEERSDPKGISFEVLCGVFDAAILTVENSMTEGAFDRHIGSAAEATLDDASAEIRRHAERLRLAVEETRSIDLDEIASVGTGYGRARLPFPKEQIRSEILCHGLGAHSMFPSTRTVLDIGGQDTKAIQVDEDGIVTNFQMNDRCAAGCGRYLGYIADELNLGLHELGPLAQQATARVKISSTCTVFAGAELRDRLSLGQKREDILAGLHRAIMLRAMSLLARSGGVEDEFTFTGGVARNAAAVGALEELVNDNYGERTFNISADSIYTGALGAAIFASRTNGRAA